MQFDAHIRIEENGRQCRQTLEDHCRNTAALAEKCLEPAGLPQAAYLAGLLHDAGKYKEEFQKYLTDENGIRGSVNHTFAGCRMLLEHFHRDQEDGFAALTCELLAYAVGAHHGLFDCVNEKGDSGFLHRTEEQTIHYEESRDNFLRLCADWPEIEQRFSKAHEELTPIYETLMDLYPDNEAGDSQLMFSVGLLARLLLSAVIEGDRRDTAEFMTGRPMPEAPEQPPGFWQHYLDTVEEKLGKFPRETEIQRTRAAFSALCRQAAERPGGVYRLNLPTGGGKTLSSLRYALAHGARWKKQRIIFVTPLLAILEQNARVIRDFIGDDSIILEHHSNVMEPEEKTDALDLRELAVESWDAPIIITTLVQLLNTLFLGKTTSIRRFHGLCNAVVVIDEVQTVPNHMLSLFNTAVNFLSRFCGTTFLLCSATQPCFEKAEHPLFFREQPDVVPYAEALWKPFRRTVIRDGGGLRLEQIPDLAREQLKYADSLLIICNKKAQSEFLYQALQNTEADCFHLSSAMCMAHRRDILSRMEHSLEQGKATGRKTVCVSTQVMEAGVDISFGAVIRLAAGMDSVVQSAGRCNRNGENPRPAPVQILQCMDENLGRLREIREGKQVTVALLNQFQRNPESLAGDLASEASIRWYYEHLFSGQTPGYQQYFEKGHGCLFDLLSVNLQNRDGDTGEGCTLCQAFKTAGGLFHVLDENTQDVVVPYGAGADLIAELSGKPMDLEALRHWLKQARPYTVSLYDYQKDALQNGIVNLHGVLVLQPEYYDSDTGLITKPESAFLEV